MGMVILAAAVFAIIHYKEYVSFRFVGNENKKDDKSSGKFTNERNRTLLHPLQHISRLAV